MSHLLPVYYSIIVSNAVDGDLSGFRLDVSNGHLEPTVRYAAADIAMPLALSADQRLLYAGTRGSRPSIVTYSINPPSGELTRLRTTPIESNLAYLSAEASGRYLLGASYGEHRVSVYSIDSIGDADGTPVQVLTEIEHAHAVVVSRDGRFAYVSSLGTDRVLAFALGYSNSDDVLVAIDEITLERGFGPRHLRLSPDETTLYVLSEFRATVASIPIDRENGRLGAPRVSERPPTLAHLDDGHVRPNATGGPQLNPETLATLIWAADIHVTPDGRFVYVSERTSSRLIVYRLEADGSLKYAGFTWTETQPRGFKIDPTGRFLVACGEKSSHVAVYAIDVRSGALSLLCRCEGGRGANWVEIIAQPESEALITA